MISKMEIFEKLPDKKYGVILADPPWSYRVWSDYGKVAANHYDCLKISDICSLPVQDISADDCILFLWTTMPTLPETFEVIKAWGFTYKTVAFTWVKKCKCKDALFTGLGYWTRANAELCLLATKGHPKRESKSVHQVIISQIREHSRKPDEARERIVQLCGNVPRIELFARQKVEGWDAWGNEV